MFFDPLAPAGLLIENGLVTRDWGLGDLNWVHKQVVVALMHLQALVFSKTFHGDDEQLTDTSRNACLL